MLAATTSLEDTGLLDVLATRFAKDHPEIELSPIAVGTGEALQLGKRGDADVLLSHDSVAEMQLVNSGAAAERRPVMFNDFIIAGPAADPANAMHHDPLTALQRIAASHSMFISRGDDSGTHRREMLLWKAAGIDPKANAGEWYVEASLGMGDALLLAGQKRAYVVTDRGTYLRFKPRIDLIIITENDPRLLNQYGVTVMNGTRSIAARVFADWVTSDAVQTLIGEFGRTEFGASLFTPSAHGAVAHDTIPTGERSPL